MNVDGLLFYAVEVTRYRQEDGSLGRLRRRLTSRRPARLVLEQTSAFWPDANLFAPGNGEGIGPPTPTIDKGFIPLLRVGILPHGVGEVDFDEGISQALLGGLPPAVIDRLLTLEEKDLIHSHDVDHHEIRLSERGQWMALGLSAFFGVIAMFVTLAGHDWVGGTIAGTTVVALAGTFIVGWRPKL